MATACCGNSWAKNSSNSSLRESSSRLRQYSRPRRSPMRLRNSPKSISLISVMTGRTVRQTLDVIGPDQFRTDVRLVEGDIGHVEDLIARADKVLRMAMAIEAPLHGQRRRLVSQRHPVDAAVAGRASDALVHMNAVIEVHEIRQPVHSRPDDRAAAGVARADRLEHRSVRPDLRVAVHARGRRRNPREIGSLHRRVAVAAIDSQPCHMMLMAEGYRLLARDALVGRVWRTYDAADHP